MTLAAFAIGTTEFAVQGLLPEIAADLSVGIPAAGLLVTGYALGVAIGGPIMAIAVNRLRRKRALLLLLGVFVAGHVLGGYGYQAIPCCCWPVSLRLFATGRSWASARSSPSRLRRSGAAPRRSR